MWKGAYQGGHQGGRGSERAAFDKYFWLKLIVGIAVTQKCNEKILQSNDNNNNCHRYHDDDGGGDGDCNLHSSKSALHYFKLKHGKNYRDTKIYAHFLVILIKDFMF